MLEKETKTGRKGESEHEDKLAGTGRILGQRQKTGGKAGTSGDPGDSGGEHPAQSRPARLSYESGALEELAESIRENGLIQPILVRQLLDGDYELIAGHRRWMAVRKLGQPTIRAIVENRTDTESAVLALVENIQRRDLDCMEEARAIAGLIESTGMTQPGSCPGVWAKASLRWQISCGCSACPAGYRKL